MNKKNNIALKALARCRALAKTNATGFEGLTIEQAITKIRKTREKLWQEKYAHSSRH